MANVKETIKKDFVAKGCVVDCGRVIDEDGVIVEIEKIAGAIFGDGEFKLTLTATETTDKDISEYVLDDEDEADEE